MIKDFTPDHLVSFLYNETSTNENKSIENVLSLDHSLSAEYNMLKEAQRGLPKAQFRPSEKAIQNILKYSQQKEATV
jgi:hypothetical protein